MGRNNPTRFPQLLGVAETSLWIWGASVSQPNYNYMPVILAFMDYNPLPDAKTIAEQLVRQRTILRLSQSKSAKRIRVHPSTLAKWERGERGPTGACLSRAEGFLMDEGLPQWEARVSGYPEWRHGGNAPGPLTLPVGKGCE